jgi:hypothetical protein
MDAQGSSLCNDAYFDNAIAQLNAIDACADLQGLVSELMASLQAEVAAIRGEITALLPTLTIPHDLGSVIAWITAQIAPSQVAHDNYLAQLVHLSTKIGQLAAAASAAAARLTSCSITVPIVTI